MGSTLEGELLRCRSCGVSVPPELINAGGVTPCPRCGMDFRISVFPALFRREEGGGAETASLDGESTCFYHPTKKVVIPCDHCGRFLCALCDVEMGDRHLCPRCIEEGAQRSETAPGPAEVIAYDSIALWMAVFGLFIFTGVFTIPVALYAAWRGRRNTRSPVRRSQWRLWIALSLVALEIGAWGLLLAAAVYGY